MTELIRLGLLSRRQGSGTFVTRPQTYAKSLSLIGTLDSVMSFAEGVTHKLLARTAASVPGEITKTFKVASGKAERLDVLYSRDYRSRIPPSSCPCASSKRSMMRQSRTAARRSFT